MSILSKEVVDHLESHNVGVFGDDIFIGSRPQQPDDCITVTDTGGFEPPKDTTSSPTIQVVSRSDSYKTGMNKLKEIHSLLHNKHNYWLGDIFVYKSEAMGEPGKFGVDENGRDLFSCNFHFRVKYY